MLNSFFDKYIFTNTLKYKNNNFFLLNIPFAIIPNELIVSISSQNNIEFNRIIYSMIKESTRKNLVRQFAFDFKIDRKKAMQLFETFFTASGWGKIQNIDTDFEGKRAILTVENSPVASSLKGKVNFPVDIMLRAIFAGIFSEVFEINVDCVESECVAAGGDRCKFIVKPENEFDLSKKAVRDQLPFKEYLVQKDLT
jgi:predicted hydrocarbon binding protein